MLSHKVKQTQTHAWSLAGEEAVAYSLARGKAASVTRESRKVAACTLARAVSCTLAAPGQRENTETVAKKKQLPSAGLDSMRGAHAHKIT